MILTWQLSTQSAADIWPICPFAACASPSVKHFTAGNDALWVGGGRGWGQHRSCEMMEFFTVKACLTSLVFWNIWVEMIRVQCPNKWNQLRRSDFLWVISFGLFFSPKACSQLTKPVGVFCRYLCLAIMKQLSVKCKKHKLPPERWQDYECIYYCSYLLDDKNESGQALEGDSHSASCLFIHQSMNKSDAYTCVNV